MPIDLRLDARRFNRLALLATLVGFGLLLVAFAGTIGSALGNQRATQAVRHTYQVIDELDALSLAVERAETAVRGYLLAPNPIRAETRRRNEKLDPAGARPPAGDDGRQPPPKRDADKAASNDRGSAGDQRRDHEPGRNRTAWIPHVSNSSNG